MKRRILSCLLVILFLTSVEGSEFQVNTRAYESQANADIAAAPNGGFIVAWNSYYGTPSGRSNDIFCRIFEPNCSPADDEFQINQITSGNQTKPSIAVKPSGEFIVAWQGPGAIEENGTDIFAQWLDANGLPLGEEFSVNNTKIQNDQACPKLAMNESGSFVIVWESDSDTEPNTTMICCRLYNDIGQAIGDEFQVNTEPDSRYPDVAIDPNGNFTIVWIEGKNSNFSIMARLYDSDGLSIAEPFEVSTIKITSFAQPAIVMDAAGCFLITWDGDPKLAGLDDIHARLYEPNGTPRGEQFVVNTTLENAQQNPQAAVNNEGQFVIVWECDGDPNVNKKDIFAQRFNATGERIGDEFRLNSYTDSDQKYPSVAIIEDGRFIAVWQSQNQDGSKYGIFSESGTMVAAADFNMDGYINFPDYHMLATEWHKTEDQITIDLIEDGIVNGHDLFAFCQSWLQPSYK